MLFWHDVNLLKNASDFVIVLYIHKKRLLQTLTVVAVLKHTFEKD